jgi:hypothetical protein
MLTEVVEANPVIVLGVAFAGITCLRSKPMREFAAIEVAGTITTPSIAIVAVAEVAAVFASTMFVTIVVVDVVGTVYRVALEVAAAVLAKTFEVVVAISYYFL